MPLSVQDLPLVCGFEEFVARRTADYNMASVMPPLIFAGRRDVNQLLRARWNLAAHRYAQAPARFLFSRHWQNGL